VEKRNGQKALVDTMKQSDIFRANLCRYMAYEGISTNGLANSTGISQKTIWVVARGGVNTTLDTAYKICAGLNIPLELMLQENISMENLSRSTRLIGALKSFTVH
jgi:DNA-binding XRE family transcriptional regulator